MMSCHTQQKNFFILWESCGTQAAALHKKRSLSSVNNSQPLRWESRGPLSVPFQTRNIFCMEGRGVKCVRQRNDEKNNSLSPWNTAFHEKKSLLTTVNVANEDPYGRQKLCSSELKHVICTAGRVEPSQPRRLACP